MDLHNQNKPRDPYAFPGGAGRQICVKTNLFDIKFDKRRSIGKFEVFASQKTREGKINVVQSRKIFPLFKTNYATELRDYEVVEGYPTEHGVIVYTVPSYPHDTFPERINADFRGDVQIDEWQNFDNELRRFLKRAALQSIAQLFHHHGFTLMKKGIYTFESDRQCARFPKQPLNEILDLVSGFKIGFETNVPNPDGSSRNMVSLDLTQTVCTRTNISLFECYLSLCTFPYDSNRIVRPEDLQGQILDTTSVSLLNRILSNIEVYILGEEQRGGRNALCKFVEILNRPATRFTVQDGRTIVRIFEDKLRKRLQFPTLNAVKLKCGKNFKHVPMELVYLSDRPQRIGVAALNILAELNQKVKELAAIVPGPRWEFIENIAGKLRAELLDSNEKNLLKNIGIQLNAAPIEVFARVLDVPADTYSIAPGTLAMPYRHPVDYVIIDSRHSNRNISIEKDVDNLMEKLYNLGIYITGQRCAQFFQCNPRNAAPDFANVVEWHKKVGLKEMKSKLLYIVVVDNESDADLYRMA
uniref:Uncharacterized protein n=1 Tax=Panagrolaimus superbus TaxID=310955 RepID=A0A914Z712_9BILA